MGKRYKYEFAIDGDWERLTDTATGKVVEGHQLSVDKVFFLLSMGEQLDMIEKDFEEDEENDFEEEDEEST